MQQTTPPPDYGCPNYQQPGIETAGQLCWCTSASRAHVLCLSTKRLTEWLSKNHTYERLQDWIPQFILCQGFKPFNTYIVQDRDLRCLHGCTEKHTYRTLSDIDNLWMGRYQSRYMPFKVNTFSTVGPHATLTHECVTS